MLSSVANALNVTDTRDSITEILQYSSRLWAGLDPKNEFACRRIYKSLSEGRKIFRLLRFVPELNFLAQIDDPVWFLRNLSRAQSIIATAFYMLDNWVYMLETVKRKSRGEIRPWKYVKNRVSLIRICMGLTLTISELFRAIYLRNNSQLLAYLVRLWHESLRMWLTLHKLRLMGLFSSPSPHTHPLRTVHVLPGAVGLVSAITSLIRKTAFRQRPIRPMYS